MLDLHAVGFTHLALADRRRPAYRWACTIIAQELGS